MSDHHATAARRPASSGSSVAASAGVGVFGAVVGYLLTYLLVASEVRETVGDDVPEWTGVAWYFYNAHLVDVEASGSIGSFSATDSVNFISRSGSTTVDVLYVVVPLVLLGAGGLLAYRLGARDLGSGVVAGAPVTLGYAVVMSLGALVAESSAEGSILGVDLAGSLAPAFVPAVVVGGVLYPLVFATVGAVLVAVVR